MYRKGIGIVGIIMGVVGMLAFFPAGMVAASSGNLNSFGMTMNWEDNCSTFPFYGLHLTAGKHDGNFFLDNAWQGYVFYTYDQWAPGESTYHGSSTISLATAPEYLVSSVWNVTIGFGKTEGGGKYGVAALHYRVDITLVRNADNVDIMKPRSDFYWEEISQGYGGGYTKITGFEVFWSMELTGNNCNAYRGTSWTRITTEDKNTATNWGKIKFTIGSPVSTTLESRNGDIIRWGSPTVKWGVFQSPLEYITHDSNDNNEDTTDQDIVRTFYISGAPGKNTHCGAEEYIRIT